MKCAISGILKFYAPRTIKQGIVTHVCQMAYRPHRIIIWEKELYQFSRSSFYGDRFHCQSCEGDFIFTGFSLLFSFSLFLLNCLFLFLSLIFYFYSSPLFIILHFFLAFLYLSLRSLFSFSLSSFYLIFYSLTFSTFLLFLTFSLLICFLHCNNKKRTNFNDINFILIDLSFLVVFL